MSVFHVCLLNRLVVQWIILIIIYANFIKFTTSINKSSQSLLLLPLSWSLVYNLVKVWFFCWQVIYSRFPLIFTFSGGNVAKWLGCQTSVEIWRLQIRVTFLPLEVVLFSEVQSLTPLPRFICKINNQLACLLLVSGFNLVTLFLKFNRSAAPLPFGFKTTDLG